MKFLKWSLLALVVLAVAALVWTLVEGFSATSSGFNADRVLTLVQGSLVVVFAIFLFVHMHKNDRVRQAQAENTDDHVNTDRSESNSALADPRKDFPKFIEKLQRWMD